QFNDFEAHMITSDKKFLPVTSAPQFIKKRFNLSRAPHVHSVFRWMEKGVSGVKLETLFISGERVTSEEALLRFFVKSTAAKGKKPVDQDADNATLQREAESLGI
ncbi:DUF1580 domain-containing protein, partial [bacterium]|nr:DUF1580 domain-containing protein [bacterium]